MRRILLILGLVLSLLTMSAQNLDIFEFIDKDGNVIPDGTTLTLTEVTSEEDIFTGEVISYMYSHVKLRNKMASNQAMRINLTIERIDNGSYQLCFPMACKTFDEETNVVTEGGVLSANEVRDLQTEWIPIEEGYCDVVLTVELLNLSGSIINPVYTYVCNGPTIKIHYRNGVIDSIYGDVNADGSIDISDVNAVINVMLGKGGVSATEADVNGDGIVDIFDVNEVINAMLGIENQGATNQEVTITKALNENVESTFDWESTTCFIPIYVSDSVHQIMEDKILADNNVNDVNTHMWIWEHSYTLGESSGMNSFGQLEDHIALIVTNVGWSGFGMIKDGGIDLSMLDDTYVLHFAMKAKPTDFTSHGFGFAQAKFTIGPEAFVDGSRVHKLLGDIGHDNEWYYVDIPFSVLRQCADDGIVFPENKGGAAAYNDNHFWCLSGGVGGSELHIDNIFLYKK